MSRKENFYHEENFNGAEIFRIFCYRFSDLELVTVRLWRNADQYRQRTARRNPYQRAYHGSKYKRRANDGSRNGCSTNAERRRSNGSRNQSDARRRSFARNECDGFARFSVAAASHVARR